MTDGLYGAPQTFACGSVTYIQNAPQALYSGGDATYGPCGPDYPIATLTITFPASNAIGSYPIGEIFYSGTGCDGYPNCALGPDGTWHAEVPGTDTPPSLGPGGYQLELTVIPAPATPTPSPSPSPSACPTSQGQTGPTPEPVPSCESGTVVAKYTDPPKSVFEVDDSPAPDSGDSERRTQAMGASTAPNQCTAFLRFVREGGNPLDAKAPEDYYIEAHCLGFMGLQAGADDQPVIASALTPSITFEAHNFSPGYPIAAMTTLGIGPCSYTKGVLFLLYNCETPRHRVPQVVPYAFALSATYHIVGTIDNANDTGDSGPDLIILNKKLVNYPYYNAAVDGYGAQFGDDPQGLVPFPPESATFRNCFKNGPLVGCTARKQAKFVDDLDDYYTQQSLNDPAWFIPSGASSNPITENAHHIQPLCWGGNNDPTNGVYLPSEKAPVDVHQSFDTWWKSFALPGPPAAVACNEGT